MNLILFLENYIHGSRIYFWFSLKVEKILDYILGRAFTCSKLTIETLEQRCEISSKLTITTARGCQWRSFAVFIVNFEHVIADWGACQLDFRFRRYLNSKICFISRPSRDHEFTLRCHLVNSLNFISNFGHCKLI